MALISINKLVELTGKARKTLVRRLANVKPVEKKGAAYLYPTLISQITKIIIFIYLIYKENRIMLSDNWITGAWQWRAYQ